jgi:hypothetical protein
MIAMVGGALGSFALSFTNLSERDRKIAEAAIWAAMAGVAAGMGDYASAAGAAVMGVAAAVNAAVEDPMASAAIDVTANVFSTAMSGGANAGAMVSGGVQLAAAGAGAGIGGLAGGKEGAITGMQLGASVGSINVNATAATNLAQAGAKIGGMAAGGGIAAAATAEDAELRGQSFQYGLQVGLSVGSSFGGAVGSPDSKALMPGLLNVGAEAAGLAGGAALHSGRQEDDSRSFIDAARSARGIAQAATGAVTADHTDPVSTAKAVAEVGGATARLALEETKGREARAAQRAAQRGSKAAARRAERLQEESAKWASATDIASQLTDAADQLRSYFHAQAEAAKKHAPRFA